MTIFGDDLSKTTRTWNPQTEIVGGKLPTSLDGVSVTINGTLAPIFYVSPGQLNVQAPSDVAGSSVQVVVRNSDGTSDPVTATIQPILPGFFLFNQNHVAAVRADGSYVGPAGLLEGLITTPTKVGETISLFGTGFGPTSPHVSSGEVFQGAAALTNPVEVRIGPAYADVRFAGLSSAGLYQVNLGVPNLPAGDHDVRATIGRVRTQPLARLRVQL